MNYLLRLRCLNDNKIFNFGADNSRPTKFYNLQGKFEIGNHDTDTKCEPQSDKAICTGGKICQSLEELKE